eukprot:2242221-Rhodomonas_salina.1
MPRHADRTEPHAVRRRESACLRLVLLMIILVYTSPARRLHTTSLTTGGNQSQETSVSLQFGLPVRHAKAIRSLTRVQHIAVPGTTILCRQHLMAVHTSAYSHVRVYA